MSGQKSFESKSLEYKAMASDIEGVLKEVEEENNFIAAALEKQPDFTIPELSILQPDILLETVRCQTPEEQAHFLEQKDKTGRSNGLLFAQFLYNFYAKIREEKVVKYVTVVLDRLLQANPSCARYFHALLSPETNIFTPFLTLLLPDYSSSASLGSSVVNVYPPAMYFCVQRIVAALLRGAPENNPEVQKSTTSFFKYLIDEKLASKRLRGHALIITLSVAKEMLRKNENVQIFLERGGLKALTQYLSKDTTNSQLLYVLIFNLWMLSFSEIATEPMIHEKVVAKLCLLLKVSVVEKVVRISCATLRNLMELKAKVVGKEMIGAEAHKTLDSLSKRKWKDQDVVNDIAYLQAQCEEIVKELSSFEVYQAEVLSGCLTWSPAHTNEKFWRENIHHFEKHDFELVRSLIACLQSEDDLVKEVACHDLGEVARFHVDGKFILNRLQCKPLLMKYMQSPNPSLARQALLAVQKLMINNWEMLAKSSQAGVSSLVTKK